MLIASAGHIGRKRCRSVLQSAWRPTTQPIIDGNVTGKHPLTHGYAPRIKLMSTTTGLGQICDAAQ